MIEIRACRGFDELQACVDIEVETWGFDPNDLVPKKTFLLAQKIGGQVIGAFEKQGLGTEGLGTNNDASGSEAPQLVGFVMALPGIENGPTGPKPYLHSHMLAVKEAYRNRGLGVRLKLEQRLDAISRGIQHIEWTFDPLEIKNAYVNIHRLGAVAREYRPIFMVYPHLDCRVGFPLIACWRNGNWILTGCWRFSTGTLQPHATSRSGFRFRPPSTNGRRRRWIVSVPLPFNLRTGQGFRRRFKTGWQLLASLSMQTATEFLSWAAGAKSVNLSPSENFKVKGINRGRKNI